YYGPRLQDVESLPLEDSLRARVLSAHGIAAAWITYDQFRARTVYEPTAPAAPPRAPPIPSSTCAVRAEPRRTSGVCSGRDRRHASTWPSTTDATRRAATGRRRCPRRLSRICSRVTAVRAEGRPKGATSWTWDSRARPLWSRAGARASGERWRAPWPRKARAWPSARATRGR